MFLITLFLFFSLSRISSASDSNLDKYLSYLSDKGIVDEAQVSFIRNNVVTKVDSIYYLYKILKTVDEAKANIEDLQILESLVLDVFENFESLNLSLKQRESFEKEFGVKIEEIISSLERKRDRISSIENSLKELTEKVDKNIDYEKNALRRFLKNNTLSIEPSVFVSLYSKNSDYIFFNIDSSIIGEGFKATSSFNSNDYFLSFDYNYLDNIGIKFLSGCFSKAFLTSSRSILYSKFDNVRNSISATFDFKDLKDVFSFDAIIGETSDIFFKTRNIIFNIDILASAKSIEEPSLRRLEVTHSLPINKKIDLLIGVDSDLKYIYPIMFLGYEANNLYLFFRYSFNTSTRNSSIKSSAKYLLDGSDYIGASLDWLLGSFNKVDNWKVILKSSLSQKVYLTSVAGVRKEIFVGIRVNYISEIDLDLTIYLENLSKKLGYFVAGNISIPITSSGIYLASRFGFSNIDFYDDIFDLEANSLSFIPFVGTIEKNTVYFSIGLSTRI